MPCDTCFKECRYFKKRESCPNYIVTQWRNESGEVKSVHDCAPRRTMFQQTQNAEQLIACRAEVQRLQHSVEQLAQAVAMFVKNKGDNQC